MQTRVSPFCPGSPVQLPPSAHGVLDGLSFAVKDVFDIAGHVTGAGSPDWQRTHAPATATAPVVQALLDAGGNMVGKTLTDELAYSLNGENWHYGVPLNPRAPDRIPGGSSSGSVSAVAQGMVDFALGTDCGGSIRLPSSYCGVWGIRTTHGRLSKEGGVPLANSFDTVGWFAPTASLLQQVGTALLGPAAVPDELELVIPSDLFAAAGETVSKALASSVAMLKQRAQRVTEVDLSQGDLTQWFLAFRTLQARELWAQHKDWIAATNPSFGPGVRERFQFASTISAEDAQAAQLVRDQVRARMAAVLEDGRILCLPSAPGIAPMLNTPQQDLESFRQRAMHILCPAGLAGLPQVSMPLAELDGCPLGLSIAAAPGGDERLLAIAASL